MRKRQNGFTMIELVVVFAILVVLAMITGQSLLVGVMRAKRVEAKAGISGLVAAERAFYAVENRYSGSFDELAFTIDGGTRVSPVQINGKNYVAQIAGGGGSFFGQFTGDLDADAWPDVMIAQEGQGTESSRGGWQLYDDIFNGYDPLPAPSGTPTPQATTPPPTATPAATSTPAGGGTGNGGDGGGDEGGNGSEGGNGNGNDDGNGNGNRNGDGNGNRNGNGNKEGGKD